MLNERDMKLGEIIKFAKIVIKRNSKLYKNMFLFVAMFAVFTFCMNFMLAEYQNALGIIMLILQFVAFGIFLGVRKNIQMSIYDEHYSENYNRKSMIGYVNNRYFRALFSMIKMSIIMSIIGIIVILLPVDYFMTDEEYIGAFAWIAYMIIVSFVLMVIVVYYSMEISINNDVRIARSEVKSLLQFKKLKAILTVIPLSLFSGLLYFVASVVIAIIASVADSFLISIGLTNATDTMMANLTGSMGLFYIFLYCIFLIGFCAIVLYVDVLWVIKYYNMKSAVIYKIIKERENINNAEYEQRETVVNNNESIGSAGFNVMNSDSAERVDNKERTVSNNNKERVVSKERAVSKERVVNKEKAINKEIIVDKENVVNTQRAINKEIIVNTENVATKESVVSKDDSFDIMNDVKETKPKVDDNQVKQEEKPKVNSESNIVGEESMWGTSVSIEDSIIGRE